MAARSNGAEANDAMTRGSPNTARSAGASSARISRSTRRGVSSRTLDADATRGLVLLGREIRVLGPSLDRGVEMRSHHVPVERREELVDERTHRARERLGQDRAGDDDARLRDA